MIIRDYFHINNLHYYAKGSFWLILIQGLTILTGFIISFIYAHFIPQFTYGQYVYIFSLISFFGSFTHQGMDTAVLRALSQNRDQILPKALSKTFPWTLLASLPFLIIAFYHLTKSPTDSTLFKTFLLVFCLVIIYWLFRFYENFYLAKHRYSQLFILKFISQIIAIIAILTTALLTSNIFYLVLASLLSGTLVNIIFTFYTHKLLNNNDAQISDFAFANKINHLAIFTNLVYTLDKILVVKILGFEAVAIYTFAQLIPEKLKGLLKNLYTLSFMRFSENQTELIPKNFKIKLVQVFGLTTILVVFGVIIIKPIYELIYPQYLKSVYPAQILLLSLLATPAMILQAFFESKADVRRLNLRTYLSYALQLLLMLLLIPKFKIIGAAWAITGARLFSLVISLMLLYDYQRQHKLKQ